MVDTWSVEDAVVSFRVRGMLAPVAVVLVSTIMTETGSGLQNGGEATDAIDG
jgi:hypothetical protein